MLSKIILLVLAGIIISEVIHAQTPKKEEVCYNPNAVKDTSKRSIKSAAVGKIGTANITINYHSPGVRKRIIWGGLVPYDEVWVTGAHNATNIEIDKAFIVAGKTIPAGKYAIFSIPGKTQWTIIINKNWDQHLANDYEQKDDVVRIKVKPLKQVKITERLQYFIKNRTGGKGTISVAWEKLTVTFEVKTL
jgi:hypothetical protein